MHGFCASPKPEAQRGYRQLRSGGKLSEAEDLRTYNRSDVSETARFEFIQGSQTATSQKSRDRGGCLA